MIPARYAPVISAIPNTSARNASAKQNAKCKHQELFFYDVQSLDSYK